MRRRRWLAAAAAGAAILALWVARDLTDSTPLDIRSFDGREVARLETAMWRSYYEHRRIQLFGQLTTLLRQQYHARFWRAVLGAFYAGRSAVVFQRGRARSEYQLALPDIEKFCGVIRKGSTVPFDPRKVASLELEWWIVHRQRQSHSKADLENALAELQAAIFQQPAAMFQEHARLRAEAMLVRDARAEAGGVSNEDWNRIAGLLERSWVLLQETVRGR